VTISVVSSGTQTATINTRHSLYSTAIAGVFALHVDTSNLAIGDTLELSIDVAFAAGGSRKTTYSVTFAHNQSDPGKISVPVVSPYSVEFFLKQTSGTGRSFPWSVVVL
jgi:hypothetical protein